MIESSIPSVAVAVAVFLSASMISAQVEFGATVRPFLEQNCFKCHGVKKPKAGIDLTSLSGSMVDEVQAGMWLQVIGQFISRSRSSFKSGRQSGHTEYVQRVIDGRE